MNNLIDKIWHIIEIVSYSVLKNLLKLVHKELTDDIFDMAMQFVKFGIVGLSNTIISYVIYVGGLIFLQYFGIFPKVDYLVAQIVAFILSLLWSFYWNNKMVFVLEKGKERSLWKALVKTYISYSFTGLFLNSILLVFWVQICNISEFIAPIINLLVSVPLNFVINKFWAFK